MNMIELPEAMVFAEQFNRDVRGRQIRAFTPGNAPHKFGSYNRPAEEYAAILPGKVVGESVAHRNHILVSLEPGYALSLGGGGERIVLHENDTTLPKRHRLLLEFTDGAFLTVTVQGWGSVSLLDAEEVRLDAVVSPVSDEFTWAHFQGLFGKVEGEKSSVKYFAISKPGIPGVGNGYCQDILYRAKLHPRRTAVSLTQAERRAFYNAVRKTLKEAVRLGGRDSEHDLHDRPGRYQRLLHSGMVGQPCGVCGTPIEKIAYLGGACYFCPECQPA
jgi:formamidopyrimidine-DNA glycosylase